MSNFLDELLTGAREKRVRARAEMLNMQTHVTGMNEKRHPFAVPDQRASTALAKNAVRETMGYVPDQMNYIANRETFMPFSDSSNGDTFRYLRGAGVGPGTTGGELESTFQRYKPMQPQPAMQGAVGNAQIQASNAGRRQQYLDSPSMGHTANSGDGTGGSGDSYRKDASRSQMTSGYMQGYGQSGQQDTLLDMNQMTNFLDIQQSMMRRVLHSALFGEYQ